MLLDPEPRCYAAFGLRIHSRYPLPAREVEGAEVRPGDVSIDFHALAEAHPHTSGGGRRRRWSRDAGGARLSFEDDAGYHLALDFDSAGSRVAVRFNRAGEDVSSVLLGIGMGALLSLRGVTALHATTLLAGDRAIALAGRAGGGKSSLAAALVALGMPLLCDDLTPILFRDREPRVQPGGCVVRLCGDVAEHATSLFGAPPGRPGTDAKRPLDTRDLRGGFRSEEAPLAAICVLAGRDCGIDAPRVVPLPATVACVALTPFVYGSDWLGTSNAERLDFCARIASRVRVAEVWLPDGLDRLVGAATDLRRSLEALAR